MLLRVPLPPDGDVDKPPEPAGSALPAVVPATAVPAVPAAAGVAGAAGAAGAAAGGDGASVGRGTGTRGVARRSTVGGHLPLRPAGVMAHKAWNMSSAKPLRERGEGEVCG